MPLITTRMRVLRAEREWSQATLAKQVGASRAFINAVEKGRYQPGLRLAFMGELVRVYHNLTTAQAQQLVDALVEVRLPAVWTGADGVKRVLETSLKLNEQILLLAAVSMPDVTAAQLIEWIEYGDDKYVMRTIRALHKKRLIEFTEKTGNVRILPPGTKAVEELIRKKNLTGII